MVCIGWMVLPCVRGRSGAFNLFHAGYLESWIWAMHVSESCAWLFPDSLRAFQSEICHLGAMIKRMLFTQRILFRLNHSALQGAAFLLPVQCLQLIQICMIAQQISFEGLHFFRTVRLRAIRLMGIDRVWGKATCWLRLAYIIRTRSRLGSLL